MSDLVLMWKWRHHVLDVEEMDSVDEAVASLMYGQEAEESAPSHIEVVSEDGTIRRINGRELDDLIEAKESAVYAAPRAAYAALPPLVAKVVIRDGEHEAVWDWYRDMNDAEADAAKLRKRLGDRVRLVVVKA